MLDRLSEFLLIHDRQTIIVLIVIVLLLYGGRIYTEAYLSTEGYLLVNYAEQKDKLEKENAALHQEVLNESSLRVIRAKAYGMGFVNCTGCEKYFYERD